MFLLDAAVIVDEFLKSQGLKAVLYNRIFEDNDIDLQNVLVDKSVVARKSANPQDNGVNVLNDLLQDPEIWHFYQLWMQTDDKLYQETFMELVQLENQRIAELFDSFSHPDFSIELEYNDESSCARVLFFATQQPKTLQTISSSTLRALHWVATSETEMEIMSSV